MGRFSIFKNCIEIKPTFDLFLKRSQNLMLVPGEETMTCRRKVNYPVLDAFEILNVEHLAVLIAELSVWRKGQSSIYRFTKCETKKNKKVKINKFMESNEKNLQKKKKEVILKINASRKILKEKIKERGLILMKKISVKSRLQTPNSENRNLAINRKIQSYIPKQNLQRKISFKIKLTKMKENQNKL